MGYRYSRAFREEIEKRGLTPYILMYGQLHPEGQEQLGRELKECKEAARDKIRRRRTV